MLPAESRACHVLTLRRLQKSHMGSTQSEERGIRKPRWQHAIGGMEQAKDLEKTPRAETPPLAPSSLLPEQLGSSPNGLAGLRSHMWSQSKA